MKARGVYVYGIWYSAWNSWSSHFSAFKQTVEHKRATMESTIIGQEGKPVVKRVYIAPPKGKKP